MLLIFRLGRPDVLPTSDYGVRKGFALTFGKLKPTDKVTPVDLPKPDDMDRRAKRWAPWRSVASWYLWRACDLAANKLPSQLALTFYSQSFRLFPIFRNPLSSAIPSNQTYGQVQNLSPRPPHPISAAASGARALRLRPRPLLPAAPREPLARNRRSPGLRRALPRLERAHHRRVLRPQRRLAHHRTARTRSSASSTTTPA